MSLRKMTIALLLGAGVSLGGCATNKTSDDVSNILSSVAVSSKADARKECTIELVEKKPNITNYPLQIEHIMNCMKEKQGGSGNADTH